MISTTTGVPQGAVTSPTLFNIYINELLVTLANDNVKTLAFADEIALVADGDEDLPKAISHIENWSAQFEIELNYKKSAIMIIRPDRRTRWPNILNIRGIPVVETYKYLRVLLDDTGSFMPMQTEFNKKLRNYRRQLSLSWSTKLPDQTRYLAWPSLIYSRFTYGLALIAAHQPKIEALHTKLLYQSFKGYLQTKKTPCANDLLETIMGCSVESFNKNLRLSTIQKVTDGTVSETLTEFHRKVRVRVKGLLTNNVESLLLHISKVLVNPRNDKFILKCCCGSYMTDSHWQVCSRAE